MRSIAGSPLDREDRNLNNSLYILYGVGVRVVDPIFLVHNLVQVPTVSLQRFNPVLDSDDDRVVETVSSYCNFQNSCPCRELMQRPLKALSIGQLTKDLV